MWKWFRNLTDPMRQTIAIYLAGVVGGFLALGAPAELFPKENFTLMKIFGEGELLPFLGAGAASGANFMTSLIASGFVGLAGVWLIYGGVRNVEPARTYLISMAAGLYKSPVLLGLVSIITNP